MQLPPPSAVSPTASRLGMARDSPGTRCGRGSHRWDDVADARWIAVARVELSGAGAQRGQLAFQPAQLCDFGLDLGVAVLDEVGDHTAGRLTRIAHAKHLAHLGQSQADGPRGPAESQ